MSPIMEEMCREVQRETQEENVRRFLEQGKLAIEDIAAGLGLPLEEVKKLQTN